MRNLIPIKIVSQLLLVVLLTFIVSCVHAHAMQGHAKATAQQESVAQADHGHHCPCPPLQQDDDFDGCDDCCDCACHTAVPLQQFSFDRPLSIADLRPYERFTFLPEVFLSKFVPPQL